MGARSRRFTTRRSAGVVLGAVAMCAVLGFAVVGCEADAGIKRAKQTIREADAPRIAALVRKDLEAHQAGAVEAADQLKRGFLVDNAIKREVEMRAALKYLQHPKFGVKAFIASPMSFLAAIDAEGVVIARDRVDDRMKGQNFGARFSVVKDALAGKAGRGLGEFVAANPGQPSSWSLLFAAPATDKKVVGAVLVGIPLWRLAQRLTRQLRIEQKDPNASAWVYLYKGDRIFHWDTPPEVDAAVPSAEARAAGLAKSPAGYVDEARISGGANYVFGVFPLPDIAPDVGAVVFRTPIAE